MGDELDRWADIHSDLLNEVSKHLYCYDDYDRARLVCKEWSLNLPKIPNNHRRNLWLVLPEYDKSYCEILQEKKIYHVVVPEMKDNFIRGSCFGWLICVMISSGAVRVLNPFTKAHFDLPPISALPHVNPPDWPHIHKDGEYTLFCRRGNDTWTDEVVEVHKRAIWKVVISSPPPPHNDSDDADNFMAAVIYGDCGRLAFWRLNKGERWEDSKVEAQVPPVASYFQDVIFFKDKVYAVDFHAALFVFDVNRESSLPLRRIGEAPPSPDILNKYLDAEMNKYLIVCEDGTLLMLVRHLRTNTRHGHDDDTTNDEDAETETETDDDDDDDDDDDEEEDEDEDAETEEDETETEDEDEDVLEGLESNEFDIFKLNENDNEWLRIHSLENLHGAIIGQNSSVQASSFPNIKRNHIYYSDNQVSMHSLEFPSRQDTGIFNLDNKNMGKMLSNVKFYCPPTWLLY